MNKKLGRQLHPSMGVYFAIMLLFVSMSVVFGQFLLAGIELAITAIILTVYLILRARRLNELQS